MAIGTPENQLFVKERVRIVMAAGNWRGQMTPITKAFFMMLGQFKNQLTLLTEVLSDETVDRAVCDAACKLYAIWVKKQATATDSFFKVFNDAANDATAGDAVIAMPLLVSGDEQFWLCPAGLDLSDGLVVGAYTAFIGANGTTPTTTGDGPNGILIYGRP